MITSASRYARVSAQHHVGQCWVAVQVLPDDIMILAEPTPVALVQALDRALAEASAVDREAQHHRVRNTPHSPGSLA
jgi:hypothetical protein